MINDDTMIEVANRSAGSLSYTLPELHLKRRFAFKEVKKIPFLELKTLFYTTGGRRLIEQKLSVKSEEAIKALNFPVEQEYFYSEDDVKKLMTTGSLDEFLDMLDFAPSGVHEIIKNLAVTLPLNDVEKRDAIFEKLDFNVTKAIEALNRNFDDGSEDFTFKPVQKERRTAVVAQDKAAPVQDTAPKRRVINK